MAATKGNRFWELRSKHGRNKTFSTPEMLWESACEYFKWCEDNPLIEVDYRGKDLQEVEIPKMRAFTMKGLCIFLECDESFLRVLRSTQKDFLTVLDRISSVIYTQKLTGAAAGFLNANIIARDLGLKEQVDTTTRIGKDLEDEQYKD